MTIEIKIKKEYLGGIVFDKYSLRKFRLKIQSRNEKLNGLTLISETETHRDEYGMYGKGKTDFYWNNDSPMFETVGKAVEWKLKQLTN